MKPTSQADLYVSPHGNDTWSGTVSAPFLTLVRARDAVRPLIASGRQRNVLVLLRGGTYRVNETVVFDTRDSSPDANTVTYAAYPGETPVFSAARPLTGWRRLEQHPKTLPPAAVGRIWVMECPDRFLTLFDLDGRLPRARRAGFVPDDSIAPKGEKDRQRLYFPPDAMREWENLEDVELAIRPTHPWLLNLLQLDSVNIAARTATTKLPATYPMRRVHNLIQPNQPTVWIENTLEGLTEPGRWALNTREQRLYLWPRNGEPGDEILAPALHGIVRVAGDPPVQGLRFRGLTFLHGDRDQWTATDAGLQHDWDMFDKDTALVRFRGASDCAVEACTFAHSGSGGLRLDLHCQHIRVAGCHFHQLGGTAVLLCGHGPGTLDVNHHNEIVDNHIHHCAEIYWHNPGIFVWQSGANQIAHNLIHDLPYSALVVSGVRPEFFEHPEERECSRSIRFAEVGGVGKRAYEETLPFLHARNNCVESNEVFGVMQILGDGNGIYVSGAGEGNIIQRNYLHDITGFGCHSAIRIDDFQVGTVVRENVISGCVGGGITLKHPNRIENNLIVGLLGGATATNTTPGLWGYLLLRRGPIAGAVLQRNVLVQLTQGQAFYDEGRGAGPDWPAAYARDAETDFNLYYCVANPQAGADFLKQKQAEGIDLHSASADPRFESLDGKCLRLREDSPALALGFRPIDLSSVGPRRSDVAG